MKTITFVKVKGENGRWRMSVSIFGFFFTISNTQLKFRSQNNYNRCDERNVRMKMNLLKERGNRCEICSRDFTDTAIELHHIKSQSQYPDLRYVPSNIMLLCHDCHAGLHKEF